MSTWPSRCIASSQTLLDLRRARWRRRPPSARRCPWPAGARRPLRGRPPCASVSRTFAPASPSAFGDLQPEAARAAGDRGRSCRSGRRVSGRVCSWRVLRSRGSESSSGAPRAHPDQEGSDRDHARRRRAPASSRRPGGAPGSRCPGRRRTCRRRPAPRRSLSSVAFFMLRTSRRCMSRHTDWREATASSQASILRQLVGIEVAHRRQLALQRGLVARPRRQPGAHTAATSSHSQASTTWPKACRYGVALASASSGWPSTQARAWPTPASAAPSAAAAPAPPAPSCGSAASTVASHARGQQLERRAAVHHAPCGRAGPAPWMPCVPSWIRFRRLSRQYCSTGKSRV